MSGNSTVIATRQQMMTSEYSHATGNITTITKMEDKYRLITKHGLSPPTELLNSPTDVSMSSDKMITTPFIFGGYKVTSALDGGTCQ